uniref:Putative secreted protein n=1 Tax=Anopheles darlingi TaxID=43151 RepID=A0A2M4D5T0_ANODA
MIYLLQSHLSLFHLIVCCQLLPVAGASRPYAIRLPVDYEIQNRQNRGRAPATDLLHQLHTLLYDRWNRKRRNLCVFRKRARQARAP